MPDGARPPLIAPVIAPATPAAPGRPLMRTLGVVQVLKMPTIEEANSAAGSSKANSPDPMGDLDAVLASGATTSSANSPASESSADLRQGLEQQQGLEQRRVPLESDTPPALKRARSVGGAMRRAQSFNFGKPTRAVADGVSALRRTRSLERRSPHKGARHGVHADGDAAVDGLDPRKLWKTARVLSLKHWVSSRLSFKRANRKLKGQREPQDVDPEMWLAINRSSESAHRAAALAV